MTDLVARALELLQAANVTLDPGLSDAEVSRVQDRFSTTFGPEHRQLLQSALPTGNPSWPDWRSGSNEDLRRRIEWPVEGLLFDVDENAFWPSSWGERPADRAERDRLARANLAGAPRLMPLFSHRYLAVDPGYRPSPVFSVYQSDVIYFGEDLPDYVTREFMSTPLRPSTTRSRVPFWSDLAEGAENQDL